MGVPIHPWVCCPRQAWTAHRVRTSACHPSPRCRAGKPRLLPFLINESGVSEELAATLVSQGRPGEIKPSRREYTAKKQDDVLASIPALLQNGWGYGAFSEPNPTGRHPPFSPVHSARIATGIWCSGIRALAANQHSSTTAWRRGNTLWRPGSRGGLDQARRGRSPQLNQQDRYSLFGKTHHHFDLDLDLRLIERLHTDRRDAGHRVPEQFAQRGDGLAERFNGRVHDVDAQHDNVLR